MKKILAVALSTALVALSCAAASGENSAGFCGHATTHGSTVLLSADLRPAAPLLNPHESSLHRPLNHILLDGEQGFQISPYLNGDEEYEETPVRRFEIIFFISMPVTLGLSFAGIAGYKLASGTWGSFQNIDYLYLALSTVSLSFSVALHDHRVVYKKKGT
jgi:hypothetical protein